MNFASSKIDSKVKHAPLYKKILPKLPSRVIEINMSQSSLKKCFVCDGVLHVGAVPLMQTTTQVTNTQMSVKIGQLMGERLVVVASKDDLLCRKCHALVNHVDKLESDLQLVKKALRNHLKKKYGMTAQQMREIAGLTTATVVNEVESEEDGEPPLKMLKTVPSRYRVIRPKPEELSSLLKCSGCDFVTSQQAILDYHKAICPITTTEVLKCTMCDKEFFTPKLMRQHKLEAHLSQWICHFCNISFVEEKDFTSHMKSHLGDHLLKVKQNGQQDYKCEEEDCSERFASLAELKAHVGTHYSITIKCMRCDIGFQTKKQMLEHVKTHDDPLTKEPSISQDAVNVYPCPICSLNFLEEGVYLEHLQIHPEYQDHKDIEMVCGDCGEKQSGEEELQMHRLTQCMGAGSTIAAEQGGSTEVKEGTMELGPYVNAQLIDGTLVFHQDGDGKFADVDTKVEDIFPKDTATDLSEKLIHADTVKAETEGPFECGECQHVENTLDALERHMYDKHDTYQCETCEKLFDKEGLEKHLLECHAANGEAGQAQAPQMQCLQCPHCSQVFNTRRSLYQHEATHIENLLIQCPDCDERFTRDKFLNEHRDSVHPVARCRSCKKEFNNVKQLKSHEARHARTDKNAFNCTDCDRVFQTPTGLRHHMAVHTGEYKYKCEFCDKGFVSRVRCEEHRASHTKEERYSCDICGKKFSFQATYWIHRKWHDNPTPYKCEFCDRLFKHTSLLAVHKRKHTGERPYECPHCDQTFAVGNTLKRHLMLHTGKFPYTCSVCAQGFSAKHKMAIHMSKVHHHHDLLQQQLNKGTAKKDFKMVVKTGEEEENQTWVVQNENGEDNPQLLTIQTEEGESIPCTFLTDEMLGEMASSNNRIVGIVLDEVLYGGEGGKAENTPAFNVQDEPGIKQESAENSLEQAFS